MLYSPFHNFRYCGMHGFCWLGTGGRVSSMTKMLISQSALCVFASVRVYAHHTSFVREVQKIYERDCTLNGWALKNNGTFRLWRSDVFASANTQHLPTPVFCVATRAVSKFFSKLACWASDKQKLAVQWLNLLAWPIVISDSTQYSYQPTGRVLLKNYQPKAKLIPPRACGRVLSIALVNYQHCMRKYS